MKAKTDETVAVTIRLPAKVHEELKGIRDRTGAPIQHSVLKAIQVYLAKKRGA